MLKDFKDEPFTFKSDESIASQIKKQYDAYVQFWSPLPRQIVNSYWKSVFVGQCGSEELLKRFSSLEKRWVGAIDFFCILECIDLM